MRVEQQITKTTHARIPGGTVMRALEVKPGATELMPDSCST
jgi:hypothetical protein